MIYYAKIVRYNEQGEKQKNNYVITADSYSMAADMITRYYENENAFESMKLELVAEDVAIWPESIDIKDFAEAQK